MNLRESINNNGIPSSLIFSFKENKYYAIWGFEEFLSINYNSSNLKNSINIFQNEIDRWKKDSNTIAAIGYISYDAKQLFYPEIKFNTPNKSIPLIWFGKPEKIIEVDRDEINSLAKTINIKRTRGLKGLEYYKNKINSIKAYLYSGDVYQVNYTQPIEYDISGQAPFDTFINLFNLSKPRFGAYLDTKQFQILSMSPENFFTKINSKISSSPIKGTSKRSDNIKEDQVLKEKLMASIKDKAEHLMIVDLIRNDLGKICNYGSIQTENLFKVHSFKTIHHMITDICGELKIGIKEIDILKALFPGGSITGAPKESAMKIIDEIENYQRGIYTGSIGLITPDDNMIFNIAIRTLTLINDKATYPVGGGIVWDSNYKDERDEALNKSQILNL